MSGRSSNVAEWFTRLEPARPASDLVRRPDDPRLGEIIETWQGDLAALQRGRGILIGFPQDEGVCRNHGRPGAAEAPDEIRRWLYRLTPCDCRVGVDLTQSPPLDAGNLRLTGSLEDSQTALAEIVQEILKAGAIPIVLGGGHETAFGHFLGYVAERRQVGIINIDAHLDVRPCIDGLGHSGSSFRQAIEHPVQPLPGRRYVCLGALPQAVAQAHKLFADRHECVIAWADKRLRLVKRFRREVRRLVSEGCQVYVTLDADVVNVTGAPGVSAPNVAGLEGRRVLDCARLAGSTPGIASFDLVEINPRLDRDSQTCRWAALAIWNFLIGLARRPKGREGSSGCLESLPG